MDRHLASDTGKAHRICPAEPVIVGNDRQLVHVLLRQIVEQAACDVGLGRDGLPGERIAAHPRRINEILPGRGRDDQGHLRRLHHRHDRVGHGGAQRADYHGHVLLLQQALGRGHAHLRVARIVGIIGLDRAAEHATGLVDLVQRELGAVLLGLAAIGERARENGGDPDPHGLGRVCGSRQQRGGKRSGDAVHNDDPRRYWPVG